MTINVRGYNKNRTAIEEILNKDVYDIIVCTET